MTGTHSARLRATSTARPPEHESVYFDCNATTPLIESVAHAAGLALRERYANPSSLHYEGCRAMELREEARERVARLLGCRPAEVIFTSGATESIHTAVFSALWPLAEKYRAGSLDTGQCRQVLYGATEHKAVPEAIRHWLEVLGLPLACRAIPVDRHGHYSAGFLAAEVPHSALVCTMAVNNETGVIQNLDVVAACVEGARAARPSGEGPLWLVDAVQAIGKVDVLFGEQPIDYLAFTGHKLHAPKGIGVLVAKEHAPYHALFVGGAQEGGRRAGTEALPALAGLGEVLRLLNDPGDALGSPARLGAYRDELARALSEAFPGFSLNVSGAATVPTCVSFSVPGMSSAEIWLLLESHGVFVSSGSACQSAKPGFSHVLEAMGCEPWRLASATRLSFGLATTADEVARGTHRIRAAGVSLQRAAQQCGSLFRLSNGLSGVIALVDPSSASVRVIGRRDAFAHRLDALAAGRSGHAAALNGPNLVWDPAVADFRFADLSAARPGHGETAAEQFGPWSICPIASEHPAAQVHAADGGATAAFRVRRTDWSHAPDLLIFASRAAMEAWLAAPELRHTKGATTTALAFLCEDDGPLSGFPCVLDKGEALWCEAVGPNGQPLPVQASAAYPSDVQVGIDPVTLAPFLHQGVVRLIDVREPYEHTSLSPFAGVEPFLAKLGKAQLVSESQPVSQLCSFLMQECQAQTPASTRFVFLCRSGRRAQRAAVLMRHLGWNQSYSLAGGAAAIQSAIARAAS